MLKTDTRASGQISSSKKEEEEGTSLLCADISLAAQVVFSFALGNEDRDIFLYSFSLAFSSLGQTWRINSKVNMGRLHPLPGGNISAPT